MVGFLMLALGAMASAREAGVAKPAAYRTDRIIVRESAGPGKGKLNALHAQLVIRVERTLRSGRGADVVK